MCERVLPRVDFGYYKICKIGAVRCIAPFPSSAPPQPLLLLRGISILLSQPTVAKPTTTNCKRVCGSRISPHTHTSACKHTLTHNHSHTLTHTHIQMISAPRLLIGCFISCLFGCLFSCLLDCSAHPIVALAQFIIHFTLIDI